MLSYRHAFHAGNYADVIKHATLVALIDYLALKDKPFVYYETHAGAGNYDLASAEATKTGEYQQGFASLARASGLPDCLQRYVSLIDTCQQSNPGHYPGSPRIASLLARQQDQLRLCELHSADSQKLASLFSRDKRVQCFAHDGYEKIISLLPPACRRGLVMIDPSYEVKTEYLLLVRQLEKMVRRFATGIYAIWYPVVDERRTEDMLDAIANTGIKNIQRFELGLTRDHQQPGMTATGMLIINPPWTLKDTLGESLRWLSTQVYTGGYWRADQWVDE
ncbi:23S rRNA (adenine(2030)-N(6))-methyltransferase RlmJ [Simiduia agarivorans]|uniref:Ribosomal RNA large subunit methyltransferase J n=1 Tax=Simiduia agarivorans (strain DSM 21679 / JCM 13881 / BCRC 17597 / SA1) TaxID=1117647 RepID=K4KIG5_SIMAS|nr:23S rRNA (adenine(2030)-N(6))-methyltransferase RlmJ [Simiduia agarivorans]AFU97995.1 DNA utilization protein YhiR [Simiduia agarivorans SA1 = DSM 21679]